MRTGGMKAFEQLKSYYEKCEKPAPKNKALRCMGSATDAKVVPVVIDYIMTDAVRTQDLIYPIRSMGSNRHAKKIIWEFIKANWVKIYERLGGGFLVNHLAKVPSGFTTSEMADEVEKFYSSDAVK